MASRSEEWTSIPLWPHQREAVALVRQYIKDYPPAEGLAALVKMPTGTGKSGVMAVLARCIPELQNVLVLAPWSSIAHQLADDIESRFWNHLGGRWTGGKRFPRDVVQLLPSTIGSILHKHRGKPLTIVGTIQALDAIARRSEPHYNELRKRTQLVCFDEGHREPAVSWSSAVRRLDKPTVLFTATPYRNDHKVFALAPRYMQSLSHDEAVRQRFIRDVDFISAAFEEELDFLEKLLAAYRERFGMNPDEENAPRVIIRCQSSMQIRDIHAELRSRGYTAVAMHQTFPNDPEKLVFKSVQRAREAVTDAMFWVHQFKLLEGFDDPKCRMLALYDELDSTRALVQQIGRVLRNPERDPKARAVVFCREGTSALDEWASYLRWDARFAVDRTILSNEHTFQRILEVHLDQQYFEGGFRDRLDLTRPDLAERMRFRRSTIVRTVEGKKRPDLDALTTATVVAWNTEDLTVIRRIDVDDQTHVLLYAAFGNSELFPEDYVLEYRLGYTVLHQPRRSPYLFFADRFGNAPPEAVMRATRSVAAEKLERLFENDIARLNEISLLNTDLSGATIRRRRMAARDLQQTGGSLSDHLQFASMVIGYVPPFLPRPPKYEDAPERTVMRRYVGFAKGRISDEDINEGTLPELTQWMGSIATELDKATVAADLFVRYAQPTAPPLDPSPVNVLLDLDDFSQAFALRDDTKLFGAAFVPEDLCYDVEPVPKAKMRWTGRFTLVASGQKFRCQLRYESKRQRYILASKELDDKLVPRERPRGRARSEPTAYLNREQSFRIVTSTPGVIYAHSRFYRPRLQYYGLPGPQRVELLDLLIGSTTLAAIDDEKGSPPTRLSWEENTLFGQVARFGRKSDLATYFDGFDLMVCDDMGNEIADFLLASRSEVNPRVVFLHAKATGEAKPLSASALAEVAAQAVKNMEYLSPYNSLKPPKLAQWGQPWQLKKGVTVTRRIRLPKAATDPEQVWNDFLGVIRNPASRREVWLFIGNGLSVSRLRNALAKPEPSAQVIQIVYQLQSTWAAVSSMGATLRVFCSP